MRTKLLVLFLNSVFNPGYRPNVPWLRREYIRRVHAARGAAAATPTRSRPPRVPAIQRVASGAVVATEYARLRGEAIALAKRRNILCQKVKA